MKDYKEIYLSRKENERKITEELFKDNKWWLDYPWDGSLKGTVNSNEIVSDKLKNNSPRGDYNHTNVPNLDWNTLHHLIIDEFLDYLDSMGIVPEYIDEIDWHSFTLNVDGWTLPFPTYSYTNYPSHDINELIIDVDILKCFNEILGYIFKGFLEIVGEENIPNEALYFFLSFDSISESLAHKFWTPASNSFMCVYMKDENGNFVNLIG